MYFSIRVLWKKLKHEYEKIIKKKMVISYNCIKYNKKQGNNKKNQKIKALPSDFLDITAATARSIDYFVQIHMFRITNQKSFHIHYPDRHLTKQVQRPEYSIIIANDYIKSSIMPSIMCMQKPNAVRQV